MFTVKHGQVALALVCVVLGIMVAVQFRTTQDIKSTVSFQRVEDLSLRLSQTEKERDALVKQVQELKSASGAEAASKEFERIK